MLLNEAGPNRSGPGLDPACNLGVQMVLSLTVERLPRPSIVRKS
jgi:hypothetical protein